MEQLHYDMFKMRTSQYLIYTGSGPSIKDPRGSHKNKQPIMVDWAVYKIINMAASSIFQ